MSEGGQENHTVTRPSLETLGGMRFLRDSLDELRKTIPQVGGLSFFGSRPRGKEKTDPGNTSDLDTVVFYDGSEFEEGNESNPGKIQLHEELRERLVQEVSSLMEKKGLPVDKNYGINLTVSVEDISRSSTDQTIRTLIDNVDAKEANRPTNATIFPLISRFLFGVGDSLYENRKYVLDRFEEMERNGEHGEKYFRELMNGVRAVQMSGVDTSAKTPQTIEEARAVFRTK